MVQERCNTVVKVVLKGRLGIDTDKPNFSATYFLVTRTNDGLRFIKLSEIISHVSAKLLRKYYGCRYALLTLKITLNSCEVILIN